MDRPLINQLFEDIRIDDKSDRAIYLQLSEAILTLIRSGKLRTGDRLPSSRDAAKRLGVNRITVGRAYDELQAQGWLETHRGSGTYISQHIPEHHPTALKQDQGLPQQRVHFELRPKPYLDTSFFLPPAELHLDDGYPDPKLAPLKELYRAYRGQLTRSGLYNKFGSYGNPEGPAYYQEALSAYLNDTRALKTTADNILSVRGTLMGINLVCNGLIQRGDVVVSGIPGWRRAEQNFIHAGAEHIGIPVDENGLVVDELKRICRKKKVRMVYVTPHHNYPTTISLRIDRRLELLRLAEEYGFFIFEDDYDFDFHYNHRPLLPLASADNSGLVIYCGSFSKSFSPAFRMGYLVGAKSVIDYLSKVRVLLDRQGDHILDNAMAELISDGTIQRYIRRTLPIYREKRDLFCQLLTAELADKVNFAVPDGGMTVWTGFDKSIDLTDLANNALQKGLLISDGKQHIYPGYQANATRLGFASASMNDLIKSVDILKSILA